jgi:hypothetical protein
MNEKIGFANFPTRLKAILPVGCNTIFLAANIGHTPVQISRRHFPEAFALLLKIVAGKNANMPERPSFSQ